MRIKEGEVIWEPSKEWIENTKIVNYMKWLKENKGLDFNSYTSLWKWSVHELEHFWESIWEYCEVIHHKPYEKVLDSRKMPGAKWFEGSELNFAENLFAKEKGDERAIYFRSERLKEKEYSWNELKENVGAFANTLKELGVKKGDRVVAYMPNIPETVIALLASASIGAIWSSCSPDFGTRSVIDRFKQIDPVVLIAVDGYQYNGKQFDRTSVISELQKEITTLEHTIVVPYLNEENNVENSLTWNDLIANKNTELSFTSVPFDHPLWVVYSSGTTGMPKPIVHGHGGIVVEHLKRNVQSGLEKNETVMWYTSTGWVMWNILVSSLLSGSDIVLYDGSPSYPTLDTLWELTEDAKVTTLGVGAPFLNNSMKAGMEPKSKFDLSQLTSLYSTGAPLTGEAFNWVYESVKEDVWLSSSSGGTDICSGFVGGIPIHPVRVGEIQGRCLGVDAKSFDEEGNELIGEVGELVITKPMPSMPLYFWNDTNNERYIDSYFTTYPGIWQHGDWIKINESGSCIIYGRSDSTINRSGVRMGTSDVYRVVEGLPEIKDSLVIDLEVLGRSNTLVLFVVSEKALDEELENRIRESVKVHLSPKFMPDRIYQVNDIPKTLNGKKMEVPIRKLLLGFDRDKVINLDSMSNPESVEPFFKLAETYKKEIGQIF